MLRKLLGAGVLLAMLAGCKGLNEAPGVTCDSDDDCGILGMCDESVGLCAAINADAGVDGGLPEVDAGFCEPKCAEYDVCTALGCTSRYSDIQMTPPEGAVLPGGSRPVEARLVVRPPYVATTVFPNTLNFSVLRTDGGGLMTLGPVLADAGTYTTEWTPPAGDGDFLLTAAYPDDGGPSKTVRIAVDTTPPAFIVNIPPFDGGVPNAGTSFEDPNPGGLNNLWRRDQEVAIEVRTNEPHLDVNSLAFTVRGTDNAGVSFPISSLGGTCDAGFCGVARVKLSTPVFDAFRGPMPIDVQGRDLAGNQGGSTSSVNVTRWKWAFNGASGTIRGSPAIGNGGVVYFGTMSGTSVGKVFAVNPSGFKKWEVPTEAVESSLAVGTGDGGSDLVYVASNFTNLPLMGGSGVQLRAISSDGTIRTNTSCTFAVLNGPVPRVKSAASVIQTAVSGTPLETGLFMVIGQKSAIGVRPLNPTSVTLGCVQSDTNQNTFDVNPGGGLIGTNDGQFVFPSATPPPTERRIVKYQFGSTSPAWVSNPGGAAGQQIFGLALLNDNVYGTGGNDVGQGGVFLVPFQAGGANAGLLPNTVNGRVHSLVTSGDGHLYFGQEAAANTTLNRYSLTTTGIVSSESFEVGVLRASPVLGSDEKLYALNTNGELTSWVGVGLRQQWRLSGLPTGAEASPTLDCARNQDGTPIGADSLGVVYVAAGDELYSFVVDSPRMPKAAGSWPKFQHDARNTGNPATPVTNCP